jgi:hypothetical protein
MKQKYVPIEKQSKRKQKEFHATQRRDWGSISPVTRIAPNQKAYNRKKSKYRYDGEPNLDFLFVRHNHFLVSTYTNSLPTSLDPVNT